MFRCVLHRRWHCRNLDRFGWVLDGVDDWGVDEVYLADVVLPSLDKVSQTLVDYSIFVILDRESSLSLTVSISVLDILNVPNALCQSPDLKVAHLVVVGSILVQDGVDSMPNDLADAVGKGLTTEIVILDHLNDLLQRLPRDTVRLPLLELSGGHHFVLESHIRLVDATFGPLFDHVVHHCVLCLQANAALADSCPCLFAH